VFHALALDHAEAEAQAGGVELARAEAHQLRDGGPDGRRAGKGSWRRHGGNGPMG
jgi:hypothetical protein